MRKSLMVPVGLVSAAVLTVAGIAAANAATASPSEPPATGAVPATTAAGATTTIGQADAEQAALAAVPGGSVLETRLQSRDGRLVWNVHLSTPGGVVEVKVDAQTGAASLDDDRATATVPGDDQADDQAEDQADDHGGDRGDNRGEGGSGHRDGHGGGHGADDPAGHH